MDKVCIVPGCENKSSDYPSENGAISFYPFPSDDEDLYQLWIRQIGLTSPPPKSAVVCSVHFDDDSFYVEWIWELNDDAIPSIRVGEENERKICIYCASELDVEKFRTGVYNKASQSLKGDISTLLISNDDKQEYKIDRISSLSSINLKSEAKNTPHCSETKLTLKDRFAHLEVTV